MERGRTPQRRGWFAELAILGLLVGFETLCARRAFPQMDDAYLLLLIKERGAASIGAAHADRPLVGALWQRLAEASGASFWSVGFALHFVLWLALGFLSCGLWRRLFPGWERYAVVVGALTVAPIVVRTQFSTVTISLLCVLSVVGAWTSVLLTWRFVEAGRVMPLLVGLALAAAAAIFSEYGVAAAVAGATIVATSPWTDRVQRSRANGAAGGLAVVALAAYAAYLRMGDFSTRPLVDPALQLPRTSLVTRTPWNVATRFWDAVVGDLCRAAAALQLDWQSKSSLVAGAFGLLLAVALWAATRESAPPVVPGLRRRLAAAATALVVGLTPIALMRPVFHSVFASRFELPVLPLAGSCSVAIGLTLVDARFHRLIAAGFGLLIGFATVLGASDALRQRNTMSAVAEVLEPAVCARPGVTLAVLSESLPCYTAQVCTGSVTRDWPPELSRRLWIETPEQARATLGRREACAEASLSGLSERSFIRERPSTGPLWIDLGEHPPRAEPYCLSAEDWSKKGTEGNR